mgnify:CR=1 FL=1
MLSFGMNRPVIQKCQSLGWIALFKRARGIKENDKVRVFNDRGAFEGDAKITDDVTARIVVATLGYWRQLNKGTVNCISSAEFIDMGHAPTFSDSLVQVELVS